jgi:hypothetical protein
MTEPLPKEVLAKIEWDFGHLRLEGYYDDALKQAAFDRDYWREYWTKLVCPRCGADDHPTHPLHYGVLCGSPQSLLSPITRAAFVVAQKEREGRNADQTIA